MGQATLGFPQRSQQAVDDMVTYRSMKERRLRQASHQWRKEGINWTEEVEDTVDDEAWCTFVWVMMGHCGDIVEFIMRYCGDIVDNNLDNGTLWGYSG